MEKKTTILIVDDHAIVRKGLINIFRDEPDVEVVGEAANGLEAVDKAMELKPDVILMDIVMPISSGLEATMAIKEQMPAARILILTVSDRDEDLLKALRFGAQSYLLKSASVSVILDAVRRTARGEANLSPELTSKLITEFKEKDRDTTERQNMSPRELEILDLLGDGLTNREIASRLFIAESTVRTYLQRLLAKLQLRNRSEAIVYSARNYRK